MATTSIRESLVECRKDIESLRRAERIGRLTARLLRWRVDEFEETLASIHRYDSGQIEYDLRVLAREVIEFEHIVGQLIQYQEAEWRDYTGIFTELLAGFFADIDDIEFFVAVSPHDTFKLGCMYKRARDSCCYVLITSPKCDFQTSDLLPLVAHEIAHMLPEVERLTASFNRSRAKKGEILADLAGFAASGPAFAHAISYYITHEVGSAHSQRPSPRHPSLACRTSVLRFASPSIWDLDPVKDWADAHFATLDNLGLQVPAVEDRLHADSLREMTSSGTDFARFKMSEDRLRDIVEGGEFGETCLLTLNTYARQAVV